MKKFLSMIKKYLLPIIMFVVFFVIDIVMFEMLDLRKLWHLNMFFTSIFLEIAIYGSTILFLIIKYCAPKGKDEENNS